MRRDDFLLTADEIQARKRKRLRLIVVLALLLALGIGAYFGARPTAHAIKGWQARRHAQKAFAFIEQEKWKEAKDSAVAAYQLRASEPQALRAVARFLSRTRQPQALDFWKQLAERQPLTRDDRRDEASAALAAGEAERAAVAVEDLLAAKNGEPAPIDHLLAAQLALQKGAPAEALPFLGKIHEAARLNERERLQAAVLSLSASASSEPDATAKNQQDAWSRIEALSKGSSNIALDALVLLAQRALNAASSNAQSPPPNSNPPSTNFPLPALITALTAHPLAKAPQKLLALDLEILAAPDRKTSVIEQAVAQWKEGDAESLAALARWLNGKGEHQRLLESIPLDRSLTSRDLFLQHMDALGALGRWHEIKTLLESERYPLDPVMQRMYLARTNAQLGEKTASDNNWQRALEAASGDVSKLMTLAQYAEKNGAVAIADAAYTAAAAIAPKLRAAQLGRLRTARAARDTKRMHRILAEMVQYWPNDAALQNDEAYLRLLLTEERGTGSADLAELEKLAETLVQKNPRSLPHRTTLALARLRQDRAREALNVYNGIQVDPQALTPSALAVHARVLAANGQDADARAETAQVPQGSLLMEEHGLSLPR